MSKSISKDTFLYDLAELCQKDNLSPKKAIGKILSERAMIQDFKINIRGSSLLTFEANPMHFALQQFLGVRFGGNANTIVGSALHDASDFAYKCLISKTTVSYFGCLKELCKSADKQYAYINPDLRVSTDLRKIKRDAIKYFKVYYPIILNNKDYIYASEESFNTPVPIEMYRNPSNFGKISFTGTLDRLFINKEKIIQISIEKN